MLQKEVAEQGFSNTEELMKASEEQSKHQQEEETKAEAIKHEHDEAPAKEILLRIATLKPHEDNPPELVKSPEKLKGVLSAEEKQEIQMVKKPEEQKSASVKTVIMTCLS